MNIKTNWFIWYDFVWTSSYVYVFIKSIWNVHVFFDDFPYDWHNLLIASARESYHNSFKFLFKTKQNLKVFLFISLLRNSWKSKNVTIIRNQFFLPLRILDIIWWIGRRVLFIFIEFDSTKSTYLGRWDFSLIAWQCFLL